MNLTAVHALSLAVTPAVLSVAIFVLLHYGTAAMKVLHPKSPKDWLILGIVIGFVGKLLDNCYWGLAWTAYFEARHDAADWYFAYGPVANLFFRQAALIVSGVCHCIAAARAADRIPPLITASAVVGGFALFGLIWLLP